MTIQEEIKKLEQSADETERQRRIQHRQYVLDTRKMIPEIAEYIKTAVATRYLSEGGPKGPSVQRRWFIGKKYYQTTIYFDTVFCGTSDLEKRCSSGGERCAGAQKQIVSLQMLSQKRD